MAVKNVTCYDCLGEMEDGAVTKGDENCFTLNDLDAVGVKDVGPTGYCYAEAWFSEENGVVKKFRFNHFSCVFKGNNHGRAIAYGP